jgi:hypothetical protein
MLKILYRSKVFWKKLKYIVTDFICNDKLYHIMLYRVHLAMIEWMGFELTTLVVIVTNYTGSCKSNYHTTAPSIENNNL